MKTYIRYLASLLKHKWYVFIECCKLGIPWLGIIHDLSKFLPCEFIYYARNFYGDKSPVDCAHSRDFDYAWLHHQKANRHHWQYWLLNYDVSNRYSIQSWSDYDDNMIAVDNEPLLYVTPVDKTDSLIDDICRVFVELRPIVKAANVSPVAIRMPKRFALEMVADWRGAGRAYGNPDTQNWYKINKDKMILHPDTRMDIEELLGL